MANRTLEYRYREEEDPHGDLKLTDLHGNPGRDNHNILWAYRDENFKTDDFRSNQGQTGNRAEQFTREMSHEVNFAIVSETPDQNGLTTQPGEIGTGECRMANRTLEYRYREEEDPTGT